MNKSDDIHQKGLVRTELEKDLFAKKNRREKTFWLAIGVVVSIAMLIFIPWPEWTLVFLVLIGSVAAIFFSIITSIIFWLALIFCALIYIAYLIKNKKD